MRKNKETVRRSLQECNLAQLCNFVVTCSQAFEDIAELIEERSYELCGDGNVDKAVEHLGKVVDFFEHMEAKNEETLRDLSNVYLLLGDMLQSSERHAESIGWFQKSLVTNERQTLPYQSLARSYAALGEVDRAIRSLEQEIRLSPGNYFSYLLLAQLYERRGQDHEMEQCLERLLVRDPENVQGLHLLIGHHQRRHPGLDIELLRRRLIAVNRPLERKDLVIWSYHMCMEKKYEMCERVLQVKADNASPDPTVYLVLAYVCLLREDAKGSAMQISLLKDSFRNRAQALERKLDEFESIFGPEAGSEIRALIARKVPRKAG